MNILIGVVNNPSAAIPPILSQTASTRGLVAVCQPAHSYHVPMRQYWSRNSGLLLWKKIIDHIKIYDHCRINKESLFYF